MQRLFLTALPVYTLAFACMVVTVDVSAVMRSSRSPTEIVWRRDRTTLKSVFTLRKKRKEMRQTQ